MRRYIVPFLAGILLLSGCSAQKSADACIPENMSALAAVISEDSDAFSGTNMQISGYARGLAEPESAAVPEEASMSPQAVSEQTGKPVYSVLRQKPFQFCSADGTEILTGKLTDISVCSNSVRTDRWLEDMLSEITEEQKALQADLKSQAETAYADCTSGSSCDFYPYSFYMDAGMKRLDDRVLSMTVLSSANAGEDEPITNRTAYNFDLTHQKLLTLKDIIRPVSQKDLENQIRISSASRMDILKGNGLNSADSEFSGCADLDSSWYFSGDGLVFLFDPLSEVVIPYDDLNGILRKEFFPDTREACSGDLSICEIPDCPIDLNLSDSDDSWQTCIVPQGCIYNVSIRGIHHWISPKIPVLSNEVFFAGQLSGADEIRITADSGQDLHVAFEDGLGRKFSGIVGQNGLRSFSVPES